MDPIKQRNMEADRAARAAAFSLPSSPKGQSPEQDPAKREATATIKRVIASALGFDERSKVNARHEIFGIEGDTQPGWEIKIAGQSPMSFKITPPKGSEPSQWLRGLEQHLNAQQIAEIGQTMTAWVNAQAAKIHAKSRETLKKAADLIEEAGWIQGAIISATDGFDAYGAILSASTRIGIYDTEDRVEIQQSAMAMIITELPHLDDGLCTALISWNDDPARTKLEVVEILRNAALR